MNNRSYVLVSVLVLLALFVGMVPAQEEVGAVGSKVLDFTLKTYDGKTVTTADLEGKVTMLMFWFPT